ncbi:type I restriction endonuclease subunit R [Subsaximicrobium wynnwilliamsii]|uniref:Type I restriction enzyme endonuclease subunit n=1 Tax=Subsaximicrobium wynnwilliamsii TaxID=291179 RepID=A0A5C6ZMI3_9FLAO|nr:HsdR family type I site-specific deoxyribonuclease [Subsaximicrobium wynnwilliamsii]TXD84946.1 type I restriction endonuclease subunit R [Subsaximicrobium wynnwilliamsii]TXD90617.1 type I restriction endonuclease subunit R [Subsaximicrobium wynnwilliamsii]TXE05091.1 type I restriction endonuclease subunit R [Subsaximicrobium wynnwilliamsii]
MVANYKEYNDSQKPALDLLQKMGWQFLSSEQVFEARGDMYTNVILDDILAQQLSKINAFDYKGASYKFSTGSIQGAINALKNVPNEGLVQTNERVYDLITLGKSFNETVQGDRKAYTVNYIDWKNPENNVFHVTEEFEVEGGKGKRRPDLVLFVNGIPFVVIENKRRDKNDSIDEAISQNLRNQREKEGIPKLFYYAQLLLAVHPNEVKYGATGTAAKFWSFWKEDVEKEVTKLLKKKINQTPSEDRLVTEQDKGLYSLCSPKRLLDLTYKYIVFDGPDKKICRYQQYFAVQDTIQRVKSRNKEGNRQGGVIWHTTGSGKSLTMVMLSKALALDTTIESPRIIIVTDRISLDKQIFKTFVNCGKHLKKAKSGNDLIELLQDKGNEIITTIIDKFEIATKRASLKDESKNIFVLVDESHRSQYGSAHANMKRIVPNASYIGFTGTPLMKSQKSTSKKFGGFIHKYTIDQAVKDGAVLPLLYEGRSAKLSINKKQIDKGFERLAAPLSEEAQKDLKKKFATIAKIYESDNVIEEIAFDISKHFSENWKGTGFKAQLAVPKIDTAIKYQKYFEAQSNESLKINTRVVFTPPDSRQNNDDVWSDSTSESRKYWEKILERFNDQEAYETYVIDRFKESSNEVEIIIVVSKLLTGFDAPRNTVLYLAKPLVAHNLLQAIARVNRLFSGKEYGHIIDYVGVLGKLDEALTEYSALEDFDEEDLKNTVVDIKDEIRKLPVRHAEVWDIFKEVYNKSDIEALERHISEKDLRDQFYDRVSAFARLLQTALASDDFYSEFNTEQIGFYKNELKKFQSLRLSVQFRYAEKISYKEYEPRVRKLLDTYIDADEVQVLARDVNIFDKNMVEEALETYGKTAASKADFIANQMKRVITENMEKDEAFYKKFSQLIEDTINDFYDGRITEKEYLEAMQKTREDLANGYQEGIPEGLQDNPRARAFYGALNEVLIKKLDKEISKKKVAKAGLEIEAIVNNLIITDWKKNVDIQNKMENEIEDYLIGKRTQFGIEISFDEIDSILIKCLRVAKNNF